MMDVDLNLLPIFDNLYEERNVTRAAARLFLTQSAVSHAFARLRDTREVWASNFLAQDRAYVIELLAELSTRVPDEKARIDRAAFTAALQAVN